MSEKIFDDDLVAIRKNKITLTLNKPAHVAMCILDLCKVLIYEFYYDYIRNKHDNNSRLLFTDTDSFIYEIKTEDVYEDLNKGKKIFDFSNYSTKSKFYDNSNKLMVGKTVSETAETVGVPIKQFFRLKPKMYSFLVDDSSGRKKAKGANRNVFEKITHNEYKDVLLNQKSLRHSINRLTFGYQS